MGTGMSGLYSNTNGTVDGTARKVIEYDGNKMENYLLNLEHPQGGGKAKFLRDVLGYVKGDLHKNIEDTLNGVSPVNATKTQFGTKYEYDVMLKSKKGDSVSARVVVVLQNDNGKETYRIVTLYPGKKVK